MKVLVSTLTSLLVYVSLVPACKAQFSQDDCSAFFFLGFDLEKYDKFPTYFGDDSTITVAQAGVYTGPDNIEEYVRFADTSSPYSTLVRREKLQLSLNSVDPMTGTCEFVLLQTDLQISDPATTSGGTVYVASLVKVFYEISTNKVSAVTVYFSQEFLEDYFGSVLNTKSRAYVCGVLRNNCPEIYELNGSPTEDECISQLEALPLSSGTERYFDGNDQGCRYVHAVLAASNGAHCPHISFVPVEDATGSIKCQTSKNTAVSDLVDETSLALFRDFCLSPESLIESEDCFRYVQLDEVPVDEVPVDEVPVDEVPVDEVPVDEVPIDDVDMGGEKIIKKKGKKEGKKKPDNRNRRRKTLTRLDSKNS